MLARPSFISRAEPPPPPSARQENVPVELSQFRVLDSSSQSTRPAPKYLEAEARPAISTSDAATKVLTVVAPETINVSVSTLLGLRVIGPIPMVLDGGSWKDG